MSRAIYDFERIHVWQKAREGKWNGGFAPYGYELIDGSLAIAEDEAEMIRLIFDKYIHTDMGANVDASELKTERESYRKSLQQCIGAKK